MQSVQFAGEKITVVQKFIVNREEIDKSPSICCFSPKCYSLNHINRKIPQGYDVRDWEISNVVCEGAPAVKGTVSSGGRTYAAKFKRQDLENVVPGGGQSHLP